MQITLQAIFFSSSKADQWWQYDGVGNVEQMCAALIHHYKKSS